MSIFRRGGVWWLYFGSWCAAFDLDRGTTFAWREDDGPATRWLRRWWSGWHRWEDEL